MQETDDNEKYGNTKSIIYVVKNTPSASVEIISAA